MRKYFRFYFFTQFVYGCFESSRGKAMSEFDIEPHGSFKNDRIRVCGDVR